MGKRRGHRVNWWTETTNGIANWLGVVIVGVIVAASALGIAALGQRPDAASTVTYTPTPLAVAGTPTPTPTPELAERIDLPGEGAQVVFFGDSWTKGYAADPEAKGYAYLVGDAFEWDTTVLGESGTGYVNPGPPSKTFVDRSAALEVDPDVDLVVVQGSINDAFIDTAKYPQASLDDLARNAQTTIENLRDVFPNAQIVALGPTPPYLPAADRIVAADGILGDVYAAAGIPFVETLGWITSDNIAQVIDADADDHPSTEGHAYLAGKVEEALRALSQS